jgi:integrase
MARQKDSRSFEISKIRGTVDKARSAGKDKPYWRARLKGGTRKLVWSGWATRDEAMAVVVDHVNRGLIDSNHSAAPAVRTVGDLLDNWLEFQRQRSDLRPKTVDHYEKAARHLVAWLRENLPGRVDLETVERYRDSRLREGASPRLVQQEFKVWRMAWRRARECGHITAGPLPRVKVKVDGYIANHHTPSESDVARVLEFLSGDYRLAVLLMATTGARIGEVCAIRHQDFDRATGDLTLRGKTGVRSFPLPGDIVLMLREREGEALMLELGRRAPEQCVRSRLKRACVAADVRLFTPHGLRRLVVDRLVRSGVGVATAADLVGHSPEVMLRVYRQVTDTDRRRAVAKAKLGRLSELGGVIEGPWKAQTGNKSR